MRLKDVIFVGFTEKDLDKVHKAKGEGEELISLRTSQEIADLVGYDVITMIAPGGHVSMIKAGE